jgi:hypothetical protein
VSDGAPQGANCLNLPATPTGLTLTDYLPSLDGQITCRRSPRLVSSDARCRLPGIRRTDASNSGMSLFGPKSDISLNGCKTLHSLLSSANDADDGANLSDYRGGRILRSSCCSEAVSRIDATAERRRRRAKESN